MTSRIIDTQGKEKVGSTMFMGCRAYNSTTQSLTNNTNTAVTFDSEEFDTNNIHSVANNTSRFTVPAGGAGYWRLTASVTFAVNGTNARYLWFVKNGGTSIRGSAVNMAGSAASAQMSATCVALLAEGDYVELWALQNSGGSLNIGSATVEQQTSCSFEKIDSVIGPQGPTGPSGGPTGPSGPTGLGNSILLAQMFR